MMKTIFTLLIAILTLNIFANTSKQGEMQIDIEKDFLLLPMTGYQHYGSFTLTDDDGNIIYKAPALLSDSDMKADWYAPVNVSKYKDKKLTLAYTSPTGEILSPRQSDSMGIRNYAADRARPAYHLTAKNGWLGSSCGFVRHNGKWHSFYLYNPFAMNDKPPYYIAHAVSDDLVNWSYESNVISPTFGENTDYPVGASLYYDKSNKSNFFDSANGGAIFLVKFNSGKTSIIKSQDLKVFSEVNSDIKLPKTNNESIANLFYDDSAAKWTIVRSEGKGASKSVLIYTSADLVNWEQSDSIDVDFQSPVLKEFKFASANLPPKYVLWSGDGQYLVGDFKDSKFTKISKEPLRIFYGDITGSTFWQNLDENTYLTSGFIQQPCDLMRAVGQTFSQSMSLPWKLRLIDSRLGIQLRADIYQTIPSHFGNATDGLGLPSMGFESNEFSLPDSIGNKHIIYVQARTDKAKAFSFIVGVAKFSYSRSGQGYAISRIDQMRFADKSQSPLADSIEAMLFVDTYSVETFILDGSAVLFMGDSYINPEQEFKVSATGKFDVRKVLKIPFINNSESSMNNAARDFIRLTKGDF